MNPSAQMPRRLARALLEVMGHGTGAEDVRADLERVRGWLERVPAFQVFADSDRFGNRDVRIRALRELARAAGFHRLTTEFLARVEASRQLDHLGAILDEFERLRRERAGALRMEIVSARPLSDDQKTELIRRFCGESPGDREIVCREDPGILGGFIARIGEQIHDYSVSGRLARLRRRFAEA